MREYKSHKSITRKENSGLLIIDLQDRLINNPIYPIYEKDKIIENTKALIKAANLFNLPVLVTEQKKLGETIPEVKELLQQYDLYHPIEKLDFSCYRDENFRRILDGMSRSTVLICGIEAHICVVQTALDLMENDYAVQIVEDATSSYSKENLITAIGRSRDEGAIITNTEMLTYELLREAGTEEFKKLLEITKERRSSIQLSNSG